MSYQGLMEFPYGSPFNAKGKKQSKLHTKNYLFISDDLHHQLESREENPKGGLLCQDCHTSVDIHGDGNIHGTTMGQVEVECSDCHASWVPQCYGCHVLVDYSRDKNGKQKSGIDWVASGNAKKKNGQTAESGL